MDIRCHTLIYTLGTSSIDQYMSIWYILSSHHKLHWELQSVRFDDIFQSFELSTGRWWASWSVNLYIYDGVLDYDIGFLGLQSRIILFVEYLYDGGLVMKLGFLSSCSVQKVFRGANWSPTTIQNYKFSCLKHLYYADIWWETIKYHRNCKSAMMAHIQHLIFSANIELESLYFWNSKLVIS